MKLFTDAQEKVARAEVTASGHNPDEITATNVVDNGEENIEMPLWQALLWHTEFGRKN